MKFRDLKPSDQFFQAWSVYRQKHFINNILFVVGFILCAVVISLDLHKNTKAFILVFVLLSMIVRANVVFYWRCPSCREPFHMKWLVLSHNFNRCAHCGLPRWAPNRNAAPNQAL
jgi:hypothetical protein